ncbi:C4-dicarboxylate ABC transporter substrate-binding protein [Haematobacter missouriensis]|uniref:TRAP transporter small permease protein n=1 Tax=Haematobacter missouriensis TaxID=366616 RepID=A0A212AQI1_9RHOB|nr:TRAP transporter small permease subunit [Haematobacter missouriensis]KFI25876.1 C4-dicarboxylate ABC transporter substrate-binding protein [Haematobacter missouriensis]OWJ77102.1 hypothetical protein CDV53_07090 [Haematobacter missouriensis]OWJ83728.1 hypothetical protein CDV52_10115 [Haematobacter missouriensis]
MSLNNDVFDYGPGIRASLLARISRRLAQAEMALGAALVAVIALSLLAGSVSRTLGRPLIWTDEFAVHLMVWVAFLGGSLGIATRGHMAIALLPERLGPRGRAWLLLLTDLLVMAFILVMAWLVWRWFDLPGLLRAGSGAGLASDTFNFIYTDPTLTLGVPKVWFWLIVPLTCVTGGIHALAAIAVDLAELVRQR